MGQVISTVAGKDEPGYSGDGGLAIDARLEGPRGVVVDIHGNVFIADNQNSRIRVVTAATGVISTYAGTGAFGYNGDNIQAIQAILHNPSGLCFDNSGGLLVADYGNHRIRRIDTATKIITTVAGSGVEGFSGDGGQAALARLRLPISVSVDSHDNLIITDFGNNRIRKVDTSGIIQTIAGGGNFFAEDSLATFAKLESPTDAIPDQEGNIWIATNYQHRIRMIDTAGFIHTIAGSGERGLEVYDGDGPALEAELAKPYGLAFDQEGNLYFSEAWGEVIRKLDIHSDSISRVAGTGLFGYSGDGGDPLLAQIDVPINMAFDAQGNLYFSESGSHVIRKISGLTNGTPLSIELTSFTGSLVSQSVLLLWSTSSETDNDYFQIERSIDNSNFDTIGKKQGALNSQSLLTYDWLDSNIENSIYYYRLRSVDINGYGELSETIQIRTDFISSQGSVFPIPAGDALSVKPSFRAQELYWSVFDNLGNTVLNAYIIDPKEIFSIDISALPKGFYYLFMRENQPSTGARFEILRFVKD